MNTQRIHLPRHALMPAAVALATSLCVSLAAADARSPANFEHRWDPAVGQPGTNGPIRALIVVDDGSGPALYAGGAFTEAGGVAVNNIARWDGKQWSDVGGGVWGDVATPPPFGGHIPVRAMTIHNDGSGDALYVAGDFSMAGEAGMDSEVVALSIARWDGKSWSSVGAGFHAGFVHALASFQGDLYAGGGTLVAGDLSQEFPGIARFDGEAWAPLPGGFVGVVTAMLASEGIASDTGKPVLYVGGGLESGGGMALTDVSRWDGTAWSTMPGVTPGSFGGPWSARALTIHAQPPPAGDGQKHLYASAYFNEVFRWTADGWMKMPDCNVWGGEAGTLGHIEALASIHDESGQGLYVGGHFDGGCGGSHNIVRLAGSSSHHVHFGAVKFTFEHHYSELWGRVHAVAGFEDGSVNAGSGTERVYVAGDFHYVGPYAASNIAAAIPVPSHSETCLTSHAGNITEPTPNEDQNFGCGLALDGTSAIIQTCPWTNPPTAYFYDLVEGEWEVQFSIGPEPELGGLGLSGNSAAVGIGEEILIFTRGSREEAWMHSQTIAAGDSWRMHSGWLMIAESGVVNVYEQAEGNGQWVQTATLEPSSPGVAVRDIRGDRALIGVEGGLIAYEHDGGMWVPLGVLPEVGWGAKISGDVVAVRTSVPTPQLTGVNLFGLKDGEWVLLETVVPLGEYIGYIPQFGPIAIDGDILMVTGEGDPWDYFVPDVTYIFKRHGDRWFLQQKVASGAWGTLAISENIAMIGAGAAYAGSYEFAGLVQVRDLSDCLPEPETIGDLNGDGVVDVFDLLILIMNWGECPPAPELCPADLDGNGVVNVWDLLTLIQNWTE